MTPKKAKEMIDAHFERMYKVPEIIYRTEYHISIISEDLRLDIYPKSQKYHNVTKHIRGEFKHLDRMLEFFFPVSNK